MTEPRSSSAPWAAFIAEARAAHPGIDVDDEAFIDFVDARLDHTADREHQLAGRHAADLYLACACTLGHKGAVARCMERLRPDVERTVAKARGPVPPIDDLAQRLWTRLFVADNGDARISKYSGVSPLRTWARVIAARLLIDEQRHRGARPDEPMRESGLLAEVVGSGDPEGELLEARYRDHIGAAVARALEELDTRDRTLLRRRIVEGLGTEAIGIVFGVHRTTAARWIDAALERVRAGAREILQREHGLSGRELVSLVGLVDRQLELSVRTLLRSKGDDVHRGGV